MNVAIDARKLFDGGIGSYIRGLLGALAGDARGASFTALVDPADAGRVAWPGGSVREMPVRAGKYGVLEHVLVPAAARRAGATLLHAPHYTLPLAWIGPAVVTIHDLTHVRFARFFPPGAALYARAVAGAAARRAQVVIADSTHTRDDVVRYLDIAPARVRVVPLGVSPALAPPPSERVAAFLSRHRLPRDYVLYVGARKRHKNLGLLLDALALVPAEERPPLVLSGRPWDAGDPLAVLAARRGLSDHVRFAAGIDDDADLACLYAGAALYAQPSLGEGFGLPPLEAMACGTPVLSSDAGALPETVGDAAVLLPPSEPGPWAEAIATLLGDAARREELRARGIAHARAFTWERCARMTRAIYAEAAG